MKKNIVISLFLIITASLATDISAAAGNYPEWLDRSVFYQIYPSSYMDSDGNGIGDINGIISKLDYIKSIGVTAIWLNPVYESGWMDGGYDVIDYYKVDPRFGTNTDIVNLFNEAHKRGIKVIMDLVAGHTSNQNKWFLQSMEADANQRYSDYYIWTDEITEKDKKDIEERYRQPNPQSSTIGLFVEKNAPRGKYYYKNYYEAQPALNYGFANPDPSKPWEQSVDAPGPKAVWQELRNIMVFWFDKGADGFRVDMAQSLVKNDDSHLVTSRMWKSFTAWIHEHYPDNVLLAEWSDPEVSLPAGFNVDFFLPWRSATGYTKLILPEPYGKHATNYFNKAGLGEVREFVDFYTRTLKTVSEYGYMAPQTSNHDVQRPNAYTRNTIDQLKVAITFFLTLKSIPFIYYGDEIGMKYNENAPEKEGSREVFSSGFVNERSGSRTPMQWTNGKNAGFSTCDPGDLFLPVDTDGGKLTVEAQDADPNSLLNYVRKILTLRQESPAMSNTGSWEYVADPDQPYPMVYKRYSGDELYLVALNPSGKKVSVQFKTMGRSRAEAFSTVGKATYKTGKSVDKIEMGPVSAVIYKLTSPEDRPIYKDPGAGIDDRIEDLLGRMTVEEKVGQLMCPYGWPMYERDGKGGVRLTEEFYRQMEKIPVGNLWGLMRADPWTRKTLDNGLNPELAAEISNKIQKYAVEQTRLGIPLMFAEEAPHGHMAIGSTCFPTALMLASTFDEDILFEMGKIVGEEIRTQGAHIAYGPVVDIAREPRWGRVEETYGEDPYLTGVLASAIVRGEQGCDFSDGRHVFSTLKHFAAYGIPEGGLNGAPSYVGMRKVFSDYLPQFKRAVKSGAMGVMTSYNSIDGVPCSSNSYLLTDILRNDWGFKGVVISDLGAIEGVASTHRVAKNREEAAIMSLGAGVDIDLKGDAFINLINAAKEGRVSGDDLDRAVRNVLRRKFEFGLFENPYVNPDVARKTVRSVSNLETARQIARKGVVLLKNDGILPLSKEIRSIAVIGPNADEMYNQLGDYTAPQKREEISTVLDGIKAKLPDARINYVKGCAIRDTSLTDIESAVRAAKESEVTVLVVGGSSARDFETEYESSGAAVVNRAHLSDMESGEGYDRSDLTLMGDQMKLMEALIDAGVKLVVIYIEGRPLNMNLASERADALCSAFYPGCQGGDGIADVLFGDYNPAGRLPIGIPRNIGQIPVYYSKGRFSNYLDGPSSPLYPFGYGLSYTTFEYSDLQMKPGDGKDIYQTVTVTITNTGDRDGDEVVQLYINDLVSSVVTSNRLLKGFRRISLKKGESRQVTFNLGFEELSLFDGAMEQVVEPGDFEVMVGASSSDIRLRGRFTIE